MPDKSKHDEWRRAVTRVGVASELRAKVASTGNLEALRIARELHDEACDAAHAAYVRLRSSEHPLLKLLGEHRG